MHKHSVNPVKVREVFKETVRPRSPSLPYRYVEVVPSYASFESHKKAYHRKVPIHFVDEVIYEKRASPPKDHRHRDNLLGGAPSSKTYSVEEPESVIKGTHSKDHSFEVRDPLNRGSPSRELNPEVHESSLQRPPSRYHSFDGPQLSSRAPSSRKHSFEERGSVGSIQSNKARHRRRRERALPESSINQPWEEPHIFYPRSHDEVVVVTETFEYHPKKQTNDEEERRRQEQIDRATSGSRKAKQFSAEEAERYYRDDWSSAWPVEQQTPSPVRKPYRGYRRERYSDSDLTESKITYGLGLCLKCVVLLTIH